MLPNVLHSIRTLISRTQDLPKDIFVVLIIFFVATGAFLVGWYAGGEEKRAGELRIVDYAAVSAGVIAATTQERKSENLIVHTEPKQTLEGLTPGSGMYVASRSGKTYHLPWCSGAQRIKEENKIWFASKLEAEQKGYKPAINCKGI